MGLRHMRIVLCFLLAINATHADNHAIITTRHSLNQLATKIRLLQQHLDQAHDKQTLLQKELANTEQQINEGVHQFIKIHRDCAAKETEIHQLQPQIEALDAKIHAMQLTLKKYLRARYHLSKHQQLLWLFNQDTPQRTDRLLTYYHYVMQSNKRLLDDLKTAQNTLALKKSTLDNDMNALNNLQEQWRVNQHKLNRNKRYHTTLMHALSQEIHKKQHTLNLYKHNQINLSRLLTHLAQQSVLQTRHPFTQMKTKLIKPVNTERQHIKRMNQGIVFYAPEGSRVHAVSPGKVVFCNWLNGYGLLLIIDHGWGFMTLYANNLALFKQKGDTVSQGEQIATVGHSGALRQNGLYFEIRHRGKAVPPLEWLR